MEKGLIWNLIAKKLAGEATSSELLQLEKMLREAPELHYSLQTVVDIWLSDSEPREDSSLAYQRHLARMEKLQDEMSIRNILEGSNPSSAQFLWSNIKKNIVWLTLSIALLTCCFYFVSRAYYYSAPLVKSQSENTVSEVSTKNGSKTNITLPDGTKVWLNSGSKLIYGKDYGASLREVRLSGEAFFDVQKNKEKPFVIHTSNIDIKVLGTVFNVKSYPDEKTTETSLVRGSVEVTFNDRPGEKVILKPNEKLIVSNNNLLLFPPVKPKPGKQNGEVLAAISHLNYSKSDSTIIESAWVQNKLIFRDELFSDLALQMERWYNVSIKFEDPAKEEMRFTGSFEHETIQQALDALMLSGKFSYSISQNKITILK